MGETSAMFCTCCTRSTGRNVVEVEHLPSQEAAQVEEEEPKLTAKVAEFTCVLQHPNVSVPLGMTLDSSGASVAGSRGIHVSGVSLEGTAVGEGNRSMPESLRLVAGDYITEVNGISVDLFRMISELRTRSTLRMRVVRAFEFEIIVVRKKDESLGCIINYDACSGRSLVVESVANGAVQRWNQAHPKKPVLAGDRILSVNGRAGTSVDLFEAVKAAQGQVMLRISRPAVP
mmetsp:Transcript_87406/g.271566  ORF Transcript_87406/g.271566 Transcript_87406/m.271566 type:complete len:231 (-) Transcript_87406:52-744(-)